VAVNKRDQLLQTQLVVESADFESYAIGARPEGELTVSLKELRAAAAFCEAAGQPVALLFSSPGAPLLLALTVFDQLTVDFVLATMGAPESSQANSGGGSQQQPSPAPTPSSFPPTVGENSAPEKEKEEDERDADSDSECVEGTPERERKRLRAAAGDFGQ
jgi:hypothetical protein